MENWNPATDALAASWRRFDWRENFLAPGFNILQALTADGHTASGAGLTRDEAYVRCIGETAEIEALARLRAQGQDFVSMRDGIAAHRNSDLAREAALCEAYERHVVADWWLGQVTAAAVSPAWLHGTGLSRMLDQARQGAAMKRRTDWWLIQRTNGPCAMICRSTSLEQQDPVLGFGVHRDPRLAAEKALRELLLMELNLMELLGARSHGDEGVLQSVSQRIRDYTRRSGYLFAQRAAVIPCDAPPPPEESWFETMPQLVSIGQSGSIPVWLCRPDLEPAPFSSSTGWPYL